MSDEPRPPDGTQATVPGGEVPPGADTMTTSRTWRSRDDRAEPAADWGWVDEWRRGDEPTPWGPGLALATFAALIIGSAVYVISQGLADQIVLAIIANVVVAAGLTPALWMSRGLPVLRWISLGGALGTLVSWISLLFFRSF